MTVIPLDGSEFVFFRMLNKEVGTGFLGLDKRYFSCELYARYDANNRAVQITRGSYRLKDQDMFANLELDLYGIGDAWKNDSSNITASFGLENSDVLPGVNGNVLEQSRSDYGRREASLNSSVFALDAGLVDFAEAVRTTSIYVPNWTNENIEKFILREQAKRLEREVTPSEMGNEPATS
jgi:hypothetical protein